MPRSSGIFTLVPSYLAVSGQTIEVENHNPPLEDIAQALTDSLPRDGSAPMTGNLPMGGNKVTGLAAGTAPGDAVRFDQLLSSASLTALNALTPAADRLPYFTGASTAALATLTAAGRAILDDADAAAQRTTLGLVIGTNVQAYDAALASLAGLSLAQGDILYATAADTLARLPKGTAGQQLRMNSGATAPEWVSAAGIVAGAVVTVTAGVPALTKALNIASVTDSGAGVYDYAFSVAEPDANYVVNVEVESDLADYRNTHTVSRADKTVNGFRIKTGSVSAAGVDFSHSFIVTRL